MKINSYKTCIFKWSNIDRQINKSKTLIKHTKTYSCRCKFDCRKFNSDQNWSKDKCQGDYKEHYAWSFIGNPLNKIISNCVNWLKKIILNFAFCPSEICKSNKWEICLQRDLIQILYISWFCFYFCFFC